MVVTFFTASATSALPSTGLAGAAGLGARVGELPAIKIGGRGQWRVEASELEAYIQRQYTETRSFIEQHPWRDGDEALEGDGIDGPASAER